MGPGGTVDSRAHSEQRTLAKAVFSISRVLLPVLKRVTRNMRSSSDPARDLLEVAIGPSFAGRRGCVDGLKAVAPVEISGDEKKQEVLWGHFWSEFNGYEYEYGRFQLF
ncbi:hypothetical protein BDW68DRAFT_182940 [Aspergillus falconensis]